MHLGDTFHGVSYPRRDLWKLQHVTCDVAMLVGFGNVCTIWPAGPCPALPHPTYPTLPYPTYTLLLTPTYPNPALLCPTPPNRGGRGAGRVAGGGG